MRDFGLSFFFREGNIPLYETMNGGNGDGRIEN